jgi:carbon monoxide dehydrogenase subunit G
MHVENSFRVVAPAKHVFSFLLSENVVVGCEPGAELGDPQTFRARRRTKISPIVVAYTGTGRIVGCDDDALTTVMDAAGREAAGSGSAEAAITIAVNAQNGSSTVWMVTGFSAIGRAARFGAREDALRWAW